MESKKKTTEAQRKAIYKYDDKFERVNCRFPKGTFNRIEQFDYKSLNAFVVAAVMEKLERDENSLV